MTDDFMLFVMKISPLFRSVSNRFVHLCHSTVCVLMDVKWGHYPAFPARSPRGRHVPCTPLHSLSLNCQTSFNPELQMSTLLDGTGICPLKPPPIRKVSQTNCNHHPITRTHSHTHSHIHSVLVSRCPALAVLNQGNQQETQTAFHFFYWTKLCLLFLPYLVVIAVGERC